MSIDPSIPLGVKPPAFNTPFETLSHVLQIQQAQQSIQSNQALEAERRQKLADDKRAKAEEDAYYQILSSPGTTDERLEAIRTNPLTAKFYAPTLKSKNEADKSAADTKHVLEEAAKLHTDAIAAVQQHQSGQAQKVIASGYNPAVFFAVAGHELELFPQAKGEIEPAIQQVRSAPQEQQQALIQQIMQGWGHATPSMSTAMTGQARQTAEEPGQIADSASKQSAAKIAGQVAAGTVGGITPEQQAANTMRGQEIKVQQQNAQTASAREQRESQPLPSGDVSQMVRTTASGRKYVDLSEWQTPKERSQASAEAQKLGVMAVSKEVGQGLTAADTARANLHSMLAQISGKLPKDPTGRLVGAPTNKLKQFFQSDADLAAWNSWRTAAIQTVQALAERGMGLRLNKSEIDLMLENDIPQITDTWQTAQDRVKNLMTMLDHKEESVMQRDRSANATPRVYYDANGNPK